MEYKGISKEIGELIKLLADLPNLANSFRKSYRKLKKDGELIKLAKEFNDLNFALLQLHNNQSLFLYHIVGNDALYDLTDEQLRDPKTLEKISKAAKDFENIYNEVLSAFKKVEETAYKRLGNVILDLGQGLAQRRRLLDELAAVVDDKREPKEIRELGKVYESLIDDIQPLREEVRIFVNENC